MGAGRWACQSDDTERAPHNSALISRLEDEVEFLRDQVRRQQEIIGAQAVTMRQLTAAAQEEPPEAAETVEEEPEGSQSPGPLRVALRRPHRGPGGAGCSGSGARVAWTKRACGY